MKIGLIVEGDSDKLFFESYFKQNIYRNMIVTSPGKKGTCKICNKRLTLKASNIIPTHKKNKTICPGSNKSGKDNKLEFKDIK